ncbi:MAG: flagellar biosynthesis protein FlhB [Rectinemataceae bacterium]
MMAIAEAWEHREPFTSTLISDIGLQWFAAEDEGRTEEPSEYKLRKAREEGRVAKSQELIGAVGLLLPMIVLVILAPWYGKTFQEMLLYYFNTAMTTDVTTDGGMVAASFLGYFIKLALPLAIAGMVSGIATNMVQVGFLFTVKPITPDFSRIVPRFGQWISKSLFSAEGMWNLAKTIIKVVIIGVASWITISGDLGRLLSAISANFWDSVALVGSLSARLIIEVAVILLVLAIPDYLFQRRQYMESLKMSKQEVKEERKMMEGDPLVKGRLRERMRELLSRNMAANVPKADVVITNPTHFAVALEWDRERSFAPVVSAKGIDEMALRIRKIATDSGVPVVENRPLARALYADVEIGDPIPEKYYMAIAAVLQSVYEASGEAERMRQSLVQAAEA